ncbi:MAG: hypothetical protein ACTMH5_18895 [Brachybacterium sp.]
MRRTLIALLCVALIIALWGIGQKLMSENSDETSDREAETTSTPVQVEDSGTLEIPGERVLGSSSFPVEADREYLVQLSIVAEKPEESPGRATYFGYTLSCASDGDDAGTVSVGGTQNLVNGEAVTLEAAALLPGTDDTEYRCRVVVANPYEGVASAGSEILLSLELTATPVGTESTSVDLDRELPRTVEPGETVELYEGQALPEPGSGNSVAVIAHLHSTTCTIVNGSREDGRAWCDEGSLDKAGSTAVYRIDLEQSNGPSTCGSSASYDVHIENLVHHYVASLTQELGQESDCEGPVTARVTVHNAGPAPLVLHRQNSEIIVLYPL